MCESIACLFLFFLPRRYNDTERKEDIEENVFLVLYHIPQIPNLQQELHRTVQGLHWLLWYKWDRAWFVRLYGR